MQTNKMQGEWVNILSKGIITIPKKIREKVGIKEGDVAKIRIEDNKIIIEARGKTENRVFTDKEIKEWAKEDSLSPTLMKKIDSLWPELP